MSTFSICFLSLTRIMKNSRDRPWAPVIDTRCCKHEQQCTFGLFLQHKDRSVCLSRKSRGKGRRQPWIGERMSSLDHTRGAQRVCSLPLSNTGLLSKILDFWSQCASDSGQPHKCVCSPIAQTVSEVRVHHRKQWGDREIGPCRGRRVFCAHFKAWMSTNS